MAKRMMNLGDVQVGTCYVSALRGTVVSIVRVAHTDAEKLAMFGPKYKKTRSNDAPMWESIGNNDGKKHIAGSADDLHKLEFVPRSDKRWFDPNGPKDAVAAKTGLPGLDKALEAVDKELRALEAAGVWGASTLRGDFKRLDDNFLAVQKRYAK
jgi:hypothetical protein